MKTYLQAETSLGTVVLGNPDPPDKAKGLCREIGMPEDCNVFPYVLNNEHPGAFFTKPGFSRAALFLKKSQVKTAPKISKLFLAELLEIAKEWKKDNELPGG